MLVAITRSPGPELVQCELTHLARQPIDFARARAQHAAYLDVLRGSDAQVITLPADATLPDGLFVEDVAVVLDEVAIIATPTPPSRRAEPAAVEAALRSFRPLTKLPTGAFLEGGDVLRVGRTLYVGQSSRTDEAGFRAFANTVRPFGYAVVPVRVTGCLHLKTACCALDEESVLVNRVWADAGQLTRLRVIDVPASEPWGANLLRLPDKLVMSASFPRTLDLVRGLGFPAERLDVSELHKAESGLTCMSLVFDFSTTSKD